MMSHPEPGPTSEDVVVECELDATPETVWRALTTPEIVAEWLWPNTLVPVIGAQFTLKRELHAGGPIECEIVEAEPHRRLAYTWRSSEGGFPAAPVETLVTFELTGTNTSGTHLRVVHSAPLDLPQAAPLRAGPMRTLSELRPQRRRSTRARSGGAARPILRRHRIPDLLLLRAA